MTLLARAGGIAVWLCAALTACDAAEEGIERVHSATPSHTRRDSGGVEIIDNAGPSWTPEEGWTASIDPVLSIGAAAGPDPAVQFTRIAGVTRFDDGRIAVALAGNSEIRFFDSAGKHLLTSGRRGQGPGEFQALDYMARFRGDSLITYDGDRNTVSVFDARGNFARSSVVKLSSELRATPRGSFDDGTLLATWNVESRSPPAGDGAKSARVQILRFATILPTGERGIELGRWPGGRTGVEFGDAADYLRGVQRLGEPGSPMIRRLYIALPGIFSAARGNSFVYADAEEFSLRVHAQSGEIRRLIRVSVPRTQIPDAAKYDTASIIVRTASGSSERSLTLRAQEVVWPEYYPNFERVHLDLLGNLWVARVPPAGTSTTRGWFVFDSSGVWLGEVQLPPTLSVMEIGSDYVLGIFHDALGVESVRLHSLIKPRR